MAVLTKTLLEEKTGLFERCDTHQASYRIKESSVQIPHFQSLFRFMGKLIGKAMFDRIPINLCFPRAMYKLLAGEKLALDDVQSIDESVLLPRRDTRRVDIQIAAVHPGLQRGGRGA